MAFNAIAPYPAIVLSDGSHDRKSEKPLGFMNIGFGRFGTSLMGFPEKGKTHNEYLNA